jgi:hypothetical protein
MWINPASPTVGGEAKELPIPDKESRMARRDRQTGELEANQEDLRHSIAESKRLADEADAMIRRHRDECDAVEKGG